MKKSHIRKVDATDADWIFGLLSDPRMTQFLPFEPMSRAQSNGRLQSYLKLNAESETTGFYLLEREGKRAGYAFIRQFIWEPEYKELEIGYLIDPEFWGKGVASEISQFLIQLVPVFTPILALIHVENIPSQKIIQKLGFIQHACSKKYPDYWIWRRGM